jgi:two-component system phosphate regulon sensor histidine kinase PhoR
VTDSFRTWSSSYRARLAVGYLLVVVVFAVAWAWSLFGPFTQAVIEQQENHLLAVAQAGALTLADTSAGAQDTVDRLVARTDLRMTIIDGDGDVVADSEEDAAEMENHADRPEVREALSGEAGSDRRVSATQDIEQIYVAVPASHQGDRVVFRVSSSLDEIGAVTQQAQRTGLILLAIILAVAAFFVARITRSATLPITRLADAAHAMAAGDLRVPIPEEAGELSVLSGALNDLKQQMRTRLDDLEAEKQNLTTVLDGLESAVFLVTDGHISFANRAAATLLKAPVAGWTGRSISGAGLPASLTAGIDERRTTQGIAAFECGPDEQGRHLRCAVIPLGSRDGERQLLISISDITERVRLDEMRSDFVANASHELKTPVSAIHLLAESASDAAASGDDELAIDFAGQIAQQSEQLGRLVRDLLDLSRLESSAATEAVTDMREAISNALIGHRPAAAKRSLELAYDDEAGGEDAYVLADSTDVAVALDNLLDNAIKYTEDGSVNVRLSIQNGNVVVSITDTGIGIPADDIPRVFERFYRVDRARSRESGGTGLGLSLVRHVVERSDGSLDVTSQPGVGSTFTITLPRQR